MIEPSLVTEKLSEYFKIEVTYDLARNDTIIYGSIFLVAIFILKNTLISLINYFHGTIQKSLKAKLAEKLLGNTSIQITNFSFSKSPSEIIRNITSAVTGTSMYIFSYILLFKEFLIIVSIFTLLFSVDRFTTTIIFISLPLVSGFYYLFVAKSSKERGKIFQSLTEKYLKTLNH